jgi:hypothetical protein
MEFYMANVDKNWDVFGEDLKVRCIEWGVDMKGSDDDDDDDDWRIKSGDCVPPRSIVSTR